MKTDLFQSRGHCWVFQMCWHIECSTFTASSFRIWNSSTGIPSPQLALFVVLSKAHLTSYSRMSGSRWVITPLWLSGFWRSFLYSSFCVFLPPLLNIFCFWNEVLRCSLKNDRMISVRFQGKPFHITVIQVYAPTSNAEEAEVDRFYEDLQDLLELTPPKDVLFIIQDWNANSS